MKNSWDWIDCVFSIYIFLNSNSDSNVSSILWFNFLTVWWHVVTKGNNRSWPFGFCVHERADCWPPTESFLWCFLGTLMLWNVVWISKGPLQMFFRRVSPKQSYSFALVRTYFSPNGWHEYWEVSNGLSWVLMSKMESSANFSPLNTVVSTFYGG